MDEDWEYVGTESEEHWLMGIKERRKSGEFLGF